MSFDINYTTCTQSCYNFLKQPEPQSITPFEMQKIIIIAGCADIAYGLYKVSCGINFLAKNNLSTRDCSELSEKKCNAKALIVDGALNNIALAVLAVAYGFLNNPITSWNFTLPPKCQDFCENVTPQYRFKLKCRYQCAEDIRIPQMNLLIRFFGGFAGCGKMSVGFMKIILAVSQIMSKRFYPDEERTPLRASTKDFPTKFILLSGAVDTLFGAFLTAFFFTNVFGSFNSIYERRSEDAFAECYPFCKSLNLPEGYL